MTPLGIAALIATTALVVLWLFRVNESGVERTVRVVDKARWVIGLLFLGLAAYHLIRSGDPLMVLVAMGGFAFLIAYLLVEQPWKRVI